MKHRIGRWTVFTWPDGEFKHARHDNPAVKIAWTLDELHATAPLIAAEYDLLSVPVDR